MTYRIVLLDPTTPDRADRLRAFLPAGFTLTHATTRGDDHLIEIIRDADFAIAGQVGVSGTVLAAARRLKLLHKWGVGTDNLDLEAARHLGIAVARTTSSNAVPVAEFTIALMLAALRYVPLAHEQLRQGRWVRFDALPGPARQLSGRTVGLVGFGAIGQHVAALLRAFNCRILYTQRSRLDATEEAARGVNYAPLSDLLASADIVSLHCPLTAETANLIDAAALASMQASAVLINVARGGIVVETDLIDALKRRAIRCAAMDVFAVEPLPVDSPLLTLDNLILTPHLAATTDDTFAPSVTRMFENMQRVALGQPLPKRDRVV
jgi:phosphoglycerate dehydrogenase-like enzyme